jgi:hypothetical protein
MRALPIRKTLPELTNRQQPPTKGMSMFSTAEHPTAGSTDRPLADDPSNGRSANGDPQVAGSATSHRRNLLWLIVLVVAFIL